MKGSCHCGAVRIDVQKPPTWVASCNCSICRRLGWLIAYYRPSEVKLQGETVAYAHGNRLIGFHHCATCGCTTHWQALDEAAKRDLPEEVAALLFGRLGINARLLEGFDPAKVEVRLFDNAGR